jgi:transcription initiation factor TFIIA large subunit
MGLNELYNSIIDEVVDNVKEAFLEEGFDEQTLRALKEAWLRRISESQQPRPQVVQSNAQQQQSSQPQMNQQTQPPSTQVQVIQSQSHVTQSPQVQVIQQSQNHHSHLRQQNIPQLDGSNGTSDEDEDIDESDGDFPEGDDDVSDEEDKETDTNRDDEDPLNSGDDVSNDESSEMFETDNVVVCQYDKITRNRNKWKFHLKDGIMNINGRDYVFQKAVGDAEW